MEGRDSTGWDGIITIADGKSKYKLVWRTAASKFLLFMEKEKKICETSRHGLRIRIAGISIRKDGWIEGLAKEAGWLRWNVWYGMV